MPRSPGNRRIEPGSPEEVYWTLLQAYGAVSAKKRDAVKVWIRLERLKLSAEAVAALVNATWRYVAACQFRRQLRTKRAATLGPAALQSSTVEKARRRKTLEIAGAARTLSRLIARAIEDRRVWALMADAFWKAEDPTTFPEDNVRAWIVDLDELSKRLSEAPSKKKTQAALLIAMRRDSLIQMTELAREGDLIHWATLAQLADIVAPEPEKGEEPWLVSATDLQIEYGRPPKS